MMVGAGVPRLPASGGAGRCRCTWSRSGCWVFITFKGHSRAGRGALDRDRAVPVPPSEPAKVSSRSRSPRCSAAARRKLQELALPLIVVGVPALLDPQAARSGHDAGDRRDPDRRAVLRAAQPVRLRALPRRGRGRRGVRADQRALSSRSSARACWSSSTPSSTRRASATTSTSRRSPSAAASGSARASSAAPRRSSTSCPRTRATSSSPRSARRRASSARSAAGALRGRDRLGDALGVRREGPLRRAARGRTGHDARVPHRWSTSA